MPCEPNEGRVQTDESLQAERTRTDHELSKRREAVNKSADAVVQQARIEAAEVLQTARDAADDEAPGSPTRAVTRERSLADDALERQRATAERLVRHERAARAKALASLLRLEREETDDHLMAERGLSDEALNTRDIFLAMVSHDLRTLLGGVVMSAQLLARGGQDVAAGTQTIQRLSARMNRLISDLVDVASIEAGKLAVVPAKGDLREVVSEAAGIFQGAAAARGIELAVQTGDAPIAAMFDHDRILQVIGNLLGNALKFSPPAAHISIRAEVRAGEARVVVTDSGPGIPAENLESIFGKFRQVGRSDRRGLGLGLYISKCILDAHCGRIWAESTGAGSTFTFALPA
jgi:signal transduction histidine kinase